LEETKGGVLRLSGAMQTGRRGLTPYSLKEPRYLDLMKREVRDVISLNVFRQIELRVGAILTSASFNFIPVPFLNQPERQKEKLTK
jgi:hypothetical protein